MRQRLVLAWVVVAVAACAAPAALADGATASYRVTGTEVAFTSTQGHFVGYATGSGSAGVFDAIVDHQPLGSAATPAITGGTFSLELASLGGASTLSGGFSGGTIRTLNAGAGCTNQTFAVDGTVALAGGGTGAFDVTLTHHRVSIFGYCLTYAGTIAGTLTVS